MNNVEKVWIVFDTNQMARSFIIGIFADKYSAEKFEWEYKTSRPTHPQEYYTEILSYDFPYNVMQRQEQLKKMSR